MVHTSVHASWLNQVEVYFSIIQRKVLSPNDFTDLNLVIERLSTFATRYNQTRLPVQMENSPPPTWTTSSPGSTPTNPEQHHGTTQPCAA